jgi:hypothetical protein
MNGESGHGNSRGHRGSRGRGSRGRGSRGRGSRGRGSRGRGSRGRGRGRGSRGQSNINYINMDKISFLRQSTLDRTLRQKSLENYSIKKLSNDNLNQQQHHRSSISDRYSMLESIALDDVFINNSSNQRISSLTKSEAIYQHPTLLPEPGGLVRGRGRRGRGTGSRGRGRGKQRVIITRDSHERQRSSRFSLQGEEVNLDDFIVNEEDPPVRSSYLMEEIPTKQILSDRFAYLWNDGTKLEVLKKNDDANETRNKKPILIFHALNGSTFKINPNDCSRTPMELYKNGTITQTTKSGNIFDLLLSCNGIYRSCIAKSNNTSQEQTTIQKLKIYQTNFLQELEVFIKYFAEVMNQTCDRKGMKVCHNLNLLEAIKKKNVEWLINVRGALEEYTHGEKDEEMYNLMLLIQNFLENMYPLYKEHASDLYTNKEDGYSTIESSYALFRKREDMNSYVKARENQLGNTYDYLLNCCERQIKFLISLLNEVKNNLVTGKVKGYDYNGAIEKLSSLFSH